MRKILNRKTGIGAVIVTAVITTAIIVSTTISNGMDLDETKAIANKYVPSTAKFVTSEEDNDKFEVMFHDDHAGAGFEVEVSKDAKNVKKVEMQLDNDLGSKTVELTEADIEKIIKKKFDGVTSINVSLSEDNGLYEYEVDFKAKDFYGDADVHPVSGTILDSTVKYGTAITIPVNNVDKASTDESKKSGEFITYEEAKDAIMKEAGDGFIKDIDLDNENGIYYYEAELIKDHIEYDYYVDAKTGKVTLENEHDSYFDYDDHSDSKPADQKGEKDSKSENVSAKKNNNLISESKAKEIILKKVPKASIIELKCEKDDGIFVYEGEAHKDGYEYEFEINASTGVIIDWDKDRIDHDD